MGVLPQLRLYYALLGMRSKLCREQCASVVHGKPRPMSQARGHYVFLCETYFARSHYVFLDETYLARSHYVFLDETYLARSHYVFFCETYCARSHFVFLDDTYVARSHYVFFCETYVAESQYACLCETYLLVWESSLALCHHGSVYGMLWFKSPCYGKMSIINTDSQKVSAESCDSECWVLWLWMLGLVTLNAVLDVYGVFSLLLASSFTCVDI